MKEIKICPKCQSNDIVMIPGSQGAYGSGQYIQTGFFSYAKVNRYLCCRCGYIEQWVDRDQLDKIKQKYENQK